jgi:hypothetical protein
LNLPNLEIIKLADCRRLTSCNGIEKLNKLGYIDFWSLRSLVDCSRLGNASSIRKVVFENCKKIQNYEFLSNMEELVELHLLSCSDLPSLSYLSKMNHLEKLVVGSRIIDGDIRKIYDFENIRAFLFKNMRHYNEKKKDIIAYFEEKSGSDPWNIKLSWTMPSDLHGGI